MSDVQIRPTISADLDTLADILVEVYATDGYPVEGVGEPRAWLTLPSPVGQWTACLDGTPVGHVALVKASIGDGAPILLEQQEQTALDRVAVLVRLFVHPSTRGRAVAAALMAAAEARASELGLRLVLDVMEKDRAALRLYERRGWTRLGTFQHRVGGDQTVKAVALVAPHHPSQG